ncbi:MAG: ribulose-phosphate 3-epimerase [Aerococcus sp.]|nr:ribulose-phosphate 3-epimerase [Aerococcus sp.]
MKIAPSILSADFAHLQQDITLVEQAGAEWLHIDVMDGHFVPNLTFGTGVIKAIRPHSNLVFDCHMMVEHPEHYIADLAAAGADSVTIHVESTPHLHSVLQQIQKAGMKAAVAINPATPVSALHPILSMVDMVLVMTVNPGFGGQQFIPETLAKIHELNMIRSAQQLDFVIEVDGGIKPDTAKRCLDEGADIFVAGSYVFGAPDPAEAIANLKAAEQAGDNRA